MQPRIALLAAAVLFAAPAVGYTATITYTLTASTNNVTVETESGPPPTTYYIMPLINSATGLNLLDGFTLNVGDKVDGSVTLNDPWTLPAGGDQALAIILLGAPLSPVIMSSNQSLTFYDHGVEVSPPGNWQDYSSIGTLILGEYETSSVTDPSFTFDTIDFSATITGIESVSGFKQLSSVNLQTVAPDLDPLEATPAPVPEPGSVWLLLAGLSGLWMFARRRATEMLSVALQGL